MLKYVILIIIIPTIIAILAPHRLRSVGFFYRRKVMENVSFFVDGFNLYHSVKDASYHQNLRGKGTKWLNIRSLCESYLPLISKKAVCGNIYYFSAYAKHLKKYHPNTIKRHRDYIECLKSTGIDISMGIFRKRDKRYKVSNNLTLTVIRHEEKQSDVALSVKVIEDAFINKPKHIVIISGDSDHKPAIDSIKAVHPGISIRFGFPYNKALKYTKKMTGGNFSIHKEVYLKHQFPAIVKISDKVSITKPESW